MGKLEFLAKHGDEDLLDSSLINENSNVRKESLYNIKIHENHIKQALLDEDESVRMVAAMHPKASVEDIDTALKDSSWKVRASIVKNPNVTLDQLMKLVESVIQLEKLAVLYNEKYGQQLARILVHSDDDYVRNKARLYVGDMDE